MSSSDRCAVSCASSGYLLKKCSRLNRPSVADSVWNSPSTVSWNARSSSMLRVAREQRIPVAAPQQLDHVPAGAGEQSLELLDDRAVAAHRAVEPLQVAVDDEDQVVESFARSDRQARERLGLVHLAVADEGPHLAARACSASPRCSQVAQEARLVDREQRAESHRARRELPELRHQPRMGIRAAAPCLRFRGDSGRAVRRSAALRGMRAHKRPARNAAGSKPGHRGLGVAAGAEEMVETDLEEIRRRCVARDVAAELGAGLVCAHDHRERVPAHDAPTVAARSRGCRETAPAPPAISCSGTACSAPAAAARAACARAAATVSAGRWRAPGPSAAISASSASIHSRVSCGSPSSSGRRHAAFGISFARSSRFMAAPPEEGRRGFNDYPPRPAQNHRCGLG